MSKPRSLFDPFDLLRGLGARLEKGLEEVANRGVKSDGFAQTVQKAMGASLTAKKITDELQNRLLAALNMPSRADILALGERLQMVEDRIIALASSLDRLAGERLPMRTVLPLPAPPRTRKPPAQPAVAAAPAAAQKPTARRSRGKKV